MNTTIERAFESAYAVRSLIQVPRDGDARAHRIRALFRRSARSAALSSIHASNTAGSLAPADNVIEWDSYCYGA
jgi:hypothetical protein